MTACDDCHWGHRYRHGGVELRRNAYGMDDYRRSHDLPLLGTVPGASVGARHNLEVRMYTLCIHVRTACFVHFLIMETLVFSQNRQRYQGLVCKPKK